jgi:hypothetical protein
MAIDQQYFNARTWSAFGMNLEQVRYLQDITDKINTIEVGSTADQTDQELQDRVQPLVNSMTFLLAGC